MNSTWQRLSLKVEMRSGQEEGKPENELGGGGDALEDSEMGGRSQRQTKQPAPESFIFSSLLLSNWLHYLFGQ